MQRTYRARRLESCIPFVCRAPVAHLSSDPISSPGGGGPGRRQGYLDSESIRHPGSNNRTDGTAHFPSGQALLWHYSFFNSTVPKGCLELFCIKWIFFKQFYISNFQKSALTEHRCMIKLENTSFSHLPPAPVSPSVGRGWILGFALGAGKDGFDCRRTHEPSRHAATGATAGYDGVVGAHEICRHGWIHVKERAHSEEVIGEDKKEKKRAGHCDHFYTMMSCLFYQMLYKNKR